MTMAFVLGNGVSRKGLNLNQLQSYGKIYGCNALYREFTPDVLVATDRPIATVIQESGYSQKNQFYTRRPIDGLGGHKVPQPYFGYSSGPIAVSIAAQQGNKKVYLLGFDMGPVDNNRFNNVYAGTEFYKPTDALPTFTGNWVKQLLQIMSDHPETTFIRVQGSTTALIEQFETVKNMLHIDKQKFLAEFLL